jgi:NADPH:quinone reductase-like Zn-dependent oxidoreductase
MAKSVNGTYRRAGYRGLFQRSGNRSGGVWWGSANEANVAEMFDRYAKGKIKPRLPAHFPLERGAEATRRLADRKVQGRWL